MRASEHLASRYGLSARKGQNGVTDKSEANGTGGKESEVSVEPMVYPSAWRDASEVKDCLKARGARF